jgi:hypothetical protein
LKITVMLLAGDHAVGHIHGWISAARQPRKATALENVGAVVGGGKGVMGEYGGGSEEKSIMPRSP